MLIYRRFEADRVNLEAARRVSIHFLYIAPRTNTGDRTISSTSLEPSSVQTLATTSSASAFPTISGWDVPSRPNPPSPSLPPSTLPSLNRPLSLLSTFRNSSQRISDGHPAPIVDQRHTNRPL